MRGRPKIALLAIAKNEGRYIAEWIAHHLAVGFDHIALFDNESSDNTVNIAQTAAANGANILVETWQSKPGYAPQQAAYKHWFRNRSQFFDWVMALDIDEFVVLHEDESIHAFLNQRVAFDAIGMNWRVFGDSGQEGYAPGWTTQRFTRAAKVDFGPNHIVKTLARIECLTDIGIHTPHLREGYAYVNPEGVPLKPHPSARQDSVSWKSVQINHYFGKTMEEWRLKKARGRAAVRADAPDAIRSDGVWHFHNRNDETDLTIARWHERMLDQWHKLFGTVESES